MGRAGSVSQTGAAGILSGASPSEIARLTSLVTRCSAAPGDILGREGEPGDRFWLLESGRVSIEVRGRRPLSAGPGSLLGELALLTNRPRTATVTALEPTAYLSGGMEALEALLDIDSARGEIRRLVSRRLAEDLRPVAVPVRDRTVLLRPLLPGDRAALDEALQHLSVESTRRRFFSPGLPSAAIVDHLIDIDYVDHFAWVAVEPGSGRGLATGRYIRSGAVTQAEVAFTTVDDWQGRGVGTVLLGAVGVAAGQTGVDRLVAYVLEENTAMRRVFAKAGAASSFSEPGVLQVAVDCDRAAHLLEPGVREALAVAVKDVVTAASLAARA